ncbi:YggS family pyridoxal phosphate-dependent enzyme [soil metagenome]
MPAAVPSVATIAERLGAMRSRLDVLGARHVTIVAVTKAFPADVIRAAVEAGCSAIGENYAQELVAKSSVLEALAARRPDVHFIGHVQSNKVRPLAGTVDVWETLDRPAIVDRVARAAPGARVMVQVNATGEETKSGCRPGDAAALVDRARQGGLDVTGLMTMGPTSGDLDRCRSAFRAVRTLADELGLASCSMGMSGDYELAVAEGSTHIRVGTMLFGERHRAE